MFNLRFLLNIVAPALLLGWAAISFYSAVMGQSGFGALERLETKVEARAAEVDAIRATRIALEKRADMLNSKSLDPDMADERIRAILGYAREGDVVISREDLKNALNTAN